MANPTPAVRPTPGDVARAKARARAKKKAERESNRAKKDACKRPTVSPETRERLYREAIAHPAFEGIKPQLICSFINAKMDRYLDRMPLWFGHTYSADTRTQRNLRAYRISRGLVEAGEQPAHLAAYRREQLARVCAA